MVFHGNASAIYSNLHIFRDLQAEGYGVWSVGYPGYPGNAGTVTQPQIVEAAHDQYETLTKSGITDIIFYGTSLGSGVASQLAVSANPKLLILDAPFNSMTDMAQKAIPLLPAKLLLKDKWDSNRALNSLDTPLIWIHGEQDNIIHVSQGQKLFDSYTGPKAAHIIPNADHLNTWLNGGRGIVLTALNKI